MKTPSAPAGRLSFRRGMLLLYALFSAGVIGGAWTYHRNYRESIINEKSELIAAIGEAKAGHVADWAEERKGQLTSLIDDPLTGKLFTALAADPADARVRSLLSARLATFIKYNKHEEAYMAAADGKVLAGAGPERKTVCPVSLRLIKSTRAARVPVISSMELHDDGRSAVHMAIRAARSGGRPIYLSVTLSPDEFLYPLIRKWPAKSYSGETLLVRRDGDDVIFLNELRHRKGTALKLRIPLSREDLPGAAAINGFTGVMRGKDYRGVPVLAWCGHVPGSDWYLVSKLDEEEAFAFLRRDSLHLLLLALALLAGGGLAGYALVKRREADYVKSLTIAEERFSRLYSKMRDAYVYVGMDGGILECNGAYERLTGYTLEELKKRTYEDITPEKWHQAERRIVEERVLKEGASGVYEKEYRRKDGSLVPVELLAVLDRDAAGGPAGMWAIVRDLTERKRAEERMVESERRLSFALETSNIGAWDMDLREHTAFRSIEHDRIFGYEELLPEWTYETFIGHVLPEDREGVDAKFKAAIEARTEWDFECRIRRKDGEVRWIWAKGRHQQDGGRAFRMAGIVQDITERKRAEEEQRLLKNRLELATSASGMGVWDWDIPRDILTWDDRMFAIFGVKKEDFGGKFAYWSLAVCPEDRAAAEEAVRKALAGEEDLHIVFRIVRPDGQLRFISGDGVMLRGPDGKAERMIGVNRDVTETEQAAERVRAEKERAETYLDIVGVMMVALEPDQSISMINKEGCRLLGRGRGELIGGNWFDLTIPPDQQEAVKGVFDRIIAGDLAPVEHFENDIVSSDGTRRTIAWTNSVRRNASGEIIGLLSSGTDITERKKAERELEKYSVELAAKNKELEEFMYAASHDLRGPLVNVQGFSQNIRGYCAELAEELRPPAGGRAAELLEKKLPEALGFLLSGAARIDGMINSLLKISRVGRAMMSPERLDMNKLAGGLISSMTFQIKEEGADIKAGPLPACWGDATQLAQVFANLLENALKYRRPGIKPKVEVNGRETGDGWCEYSVADNGRGLSEAEASGRIWEMFYRGDEKEPQKGDGIGLTVAKRIIERHGGMMTAARRPEGGAVFTVRLRSGGSHERKN